jgi:pyrimidine deaminase RibD-like protein
VAPDGSEFFGLNDCANPQVSCPRAGMATGEGYPLCRDICQQGAHAEMVALAAAGDATRGAALFLSGHTYACEPCRTACDRAGIARIIIEAAN